MKPHSNTAKLYLVLSLVILGALPVEFLLSAVPAMASHFHLSLPVAGLSISLYALGVACSQPLVSALALRWGRKPVMVGGLALSGVAAAAAVLIEHGNLLLVLRLVQGLGGGSLVLVHGLLAGRDPRTQRQLTALALLAAVLVAVAPWLGDLLQHHFGWQAVFLAYEFITLLCVGLLIGILAEEPLAERAGVALATVRQALGNGPATGYALLAGLAFSCHFSALAGIVVVGTEVFGLGSHTVALALLGYGVAGLASELLAGALAARLSGNAQARLGLLIIGIVAGLLALSLREASLIWFLGPLVASTLGTSLVRNGATTQALGLATHTQAAKVIGNTLTFGCAGLLSAMALLVESDVRMGLLVLYVGCTLVAALLLAAVSEYTPDDSRAVNL